MANSRLPDEIHMARGNLQPYCHGRLKDKPQFKPVAADAPPDWMPDEAADEWRRIVPILAGAGLLKESDYVMLVNYCLLFGRVRTELYKTPPSVLAQLTSCCNHFGLSPMARSKIVVKQPDKPDDNPWAEFARTTSKSPKTTAVQ